jgi:hypothetical protein
MRWRREDRGLWLLLEVEEYFRWRFSVMPGNASEELQWHLESSWCFGINRGKGAAKKARG